MPGRLAGILQERDNGYAFTYLPEYLDSDVVTAVSLSLPLQSDPFEERHQVVGIEDCGAGIVSILLAGFAPIGIGGGNIIDSGTKSLCTHYEENFESLLRRLR